MILPICQAAGQASHVASKETANTAIIKVVWRLRLISVNSMVSEKNLIVAFDIKHNQLT